MRTEVTGISLPRMTGALCGALAILLRVSRAGGRAVHSTFLIQVAPNLAPMQRNTAVSLALSGLPRQIWDEMNFTSSMPK
jgi:hypothetical protein